MKQENILRLLIIDDSSNDAELTVAMLRRAGHGVRALRAAALDDFKKALDEQPLDLILCNPLTSRLSAAQALTLLRESGKDIPLIVTAESPDQAQVCELLQAGARDVVPKEQVERLQYVAARELADLDLRRAYRRCETGLREAEKRCRSLLDSSRDAIAYVHEGMHSYANSAYLNLFGYHNVEELEGVPIMDMVAPSDHSLFKEFLRSHARGGGQANGVSVSSALEVKGLHTSGREFNIHMEFSPASIEGESCTQVVVHDLSENEEVEKKLKALKRQDLLTGLYNHPYFLELLDAAVAGAVNGKGNSALLYIELDDFQAIKDKAGIAATDMVQSDVAALLRGKVSEADSLARFGDALFAALLPNKTMEHAQQIGEAVRQAVGDTIFDAAGQSVTATCSVAVTLIGERSNNSREVLEQANRACAAAKAMGGNRVQVYNPALGDRRLRADLREMVGRVQDALQHNRFRLVFQPIVSLRGDPGENYQVLLRMLDEQDKEIEPARFMPAVEAAELEVQVDRWVIGQAIQALAGKRKSSGKTRFFIKLFEDTLRDSELLLWLSECLKAARLPGDALTFVTSESSAVNALKEAKLLAHGLNELRCRFALDHFGKSADASYLKHLPLHYLKIDGEFLADLAGNPVHQARVKAINDMAHGMNLLTVAECVQDASTLAVLWQYGVDFVQGYYFQKPADSLNYDFTGEGG
ncbi:MAG: EAL domain-containing protein [Gammaproteobacteria bacterium]|nr:MAG: EAL domain-containing protein [Gammaproteobacteria bacterium]